MMRNNAAQVETRQFCKHFCTVKWVLC